jgi:hypothetical protein
VLALTLDDPSARCALLVEVVVACSLPPSSIIILYKSIIKLIVGVAAKVLAGH